MSETQTDTFEHGIGVLAADGHDTLQDDQPIPVHGVLIPENTVLRGGQDVEHFYSPQMAERAAEVLRRQIDDGETVHLVKNFHETEGQAPADDIIGEVTAAGYSPGVGVVFEGETTDVETANKIGNGYLDVSPSVARGLGELDGTMEARAVTEVAGFRDVAVVGRGQPGVDVDVGPNPAVEALSLDALNRVFEGDTFDTYQLTDEQIELVGEALADFVESQGEATLRDLENWVFENEDLDADTRVALDAAISELFEQFDPNPGEFRMGMFRAFLENADTLAEITADGEFNGGETDTMSLDEAKETVAEEYGIELDDLESRLTESDDPEPDDTDHDTVLLVET